MTRIFSGIQPTSQPTLGNYIGALSRWTENQHDAENFYMIADLHALTLQQDPDLLRQRTVEVAATLISVGIDPEVSNIFVQSQVPQHAQLSWLLECTSGFGELSRMIQFKEKSKNNTTSEGVSVGLFTYPCLQAADILLYDTNEVPIGQDQRQHLDLTRDIAIRFNNRYGETFVVPKPTFPKVGTKIFDLQDPTKKMSKSNDPAGTIFLFEESNSIVKKIRRAVTDSENEVRYDPENKRGVSNLLEILSSVLDDTPQALAGNYEQYGQLKNDVAEAVVGMIQPIKQRYEELLDDPAYTLGVLAASKEYAQEYAERTLCKAKKNIGLLVQ